MEPLSPSIRSEWDWYWRFGLFGSYAIWCNLETRVLTRSRVVAGRIRHTFISEHVNSCVVLILKRKNRRKNTHTNGIQVVDLGSFRIHLTAAWVLSRQTRSRSDHVKLHAANCGDENYTMRACVGGYALIGGRWTVRFSFLPGSWISQRCW